MINQLLKTDESLFMQEIWNEQKELVLGCRTLYKYVNFEGASRILSDQTLAFRNPKFLNDPFDCILELMDFSKIPEDYRDNLFKKHYSHLEGKAKEQMLANFAGKSDAYMSDILRTGMQQDLDRRGITCFSKRYTNMLMWSHYSDSHQGICIGFDLAKLYESIQDNSHPERFMINVKYAREFTALNYFKHPGEAVINWLRTKSEDWSYEKEVRLILYDLSFDQHGLHIKKIPGNCIKEVYLGSRMKTQDELSINKLIVENYPDIRSRKMRLTTGKFELEAV